MTIRRIAKIAMMFEKCFQDFDKTIKIIMIKYVITRIC